MKTIRFKDFFEQNIGLGNLESSVLKAYQEFPSVLSNNLERPDQLIRLPNLDVELPHTTGNGTIKILNTKKNPIHIRLSDGTDCYFTYDEYKRINGKPALGKSMTIEFQKSTENTIPGPFKIIGARVY